MTSKNNIYQIFIFSLIIHIGFFWLIKGINFNKIIQIQNQNSVVIDLQTSDKSIEQTFTNISIPNPENIFEPIKNIQNLNLENIQIPDIKPVKIVSQTEITKDIARIPSNIPLNYKPSSIKTSHIKTSKINRIRQPINNNQLLKNYLYFIRKKIEKNKKYPYIARKMGIEGATAVEFTINKNGNLMNIKVLRSSGFEVLDKAAMNAVKQAQPFSRIPRALNFANMKLKLSIVFKVE